MADDIQPEAIIRTIMVEGCDLATLAPYRARLASTPHGADNVGAVGADWLGTMLDVAAVEELRAFATGPYKALLLRGLPLSTDVPTPRHGFLPDAECVLDFDLLHFGMLQLLGVRPHAVHYENLGKLVRNVVPVLEAAGTTSSWGADVEFFWHTDNPNWPFVASDGEVDSAVPQFLAFTAVRNLERASTDIVCVDQVLSQLPDWSVAQLQEATFAFQAPASNEGFSGGHRVLPIIEKDEKGYQARFDDGAVAALDPDSDAALHLFRQVLRDAAGIDIVLRPGEFFIFKNMRVLHRRKAFKPMPGGQARWLRRVYGS